VNSTSLNHLINQDAFMEYKRCHNDEAGENSDTVDTIVEIKHLEKSLLETHIEVVVEDKDELHRLSIPTHLVNSVHERLIDGPLPVLARVDLGAGSMTHLLSTDEDGFATISNATT